MPRLLSASVIIGFPVMLWDYPPLYIWSNLKTLPKTVGLTQYMEIIAAV